MSKESLVLMLGKKEPLENVVRATGHTVLSVTDNAV